MEATTAARSSLFGLFRILTGDTRTLVRQEVQLAKTEISEKISRMGRNAVALAVGGMVAYAGLIVFMIGLGWLLAWAFALAGLQPIFAGFLGLATIGLLVAITGCVLLFKGVKTLSKERLTPQRTLQTLHELKGNLTTQEAPGSGQPAEKLSSEQIQVRVEATENRMGATLDELGYRLSPRHINQQVKYRIQENPYQVGLIAMGAGFISGLFLTRKPRHG